MADEKIEALIHQCDESIRNRQKLFDYNFSKELLSVLPTFIRNQKVIEAQLYEKTKECEQLKEGLGESHDKVAKLYSKYEDLMKHYQFLLKNNHVEEFLDFANFLKTRCEFDEITNAALKLEDDDLFRCFDELLKDQIPKELIEEDVKHELENLKFQFEELELQFKEKNDECRRLKFNLDEANGKILTLDSELKKAHELLKEGNLQRKQVESERDNLSEKLGALILKYQQPVGQLDKTIETNAQTYCDNSISSTIESDSDLILRIDTSESEDDLDEIYLPGECGYSDSPIPPPDNFRDCNISAENIDSNTSLSKNESDETSSNVQSRNSLADVSKSPSPKTVVPSHLHSDVSSHEINRKPRPIHDIPKDDSKSTLVKCQSGNERKIGDGCIQIPNSPPVELSNARISVTPEQSHFECDTCGRSFLTKIGIIMHMRVHVETIRSFHCKKCDTSFPTKNSRQKAEKCPICDGNDNFQSNKNEKIISSDALKGKRSGKHTQIDNYLKKRQNKISGIRCVTCNKNFGSKYSLYRHTRVVHNGEKPYKCVKCDKRFGHECNLERHTLVHGSQKPFKCSVCKVGFKDLSSKKRHEQIVHERSARFQCAHCDKQYGKKDDLISHIHTKHFSGFQKQFKCTICDKSFALKIQLQRHMFSHASKRSFKCSVCDRYFKFPNDRTHHEMTVHGKGVRFRCKHCDKVYRNKTNFIRHLEKNHVE